MLSLAATAQSAFVKNSAMSGGALYLASGTATWTATGGMPTVEVPGLTIVPSERILYAATHGLGGWVMDLGKLK